MLDVQEFAESKNGSTALSKATAVREIGSSGLVRSGGIVAEEFHPDLRGNRAAQVYTEMSNNDAVVGAVLFLVDMLVRRVTWTTKAVDDKNQSLKDAEFLGSQLHDMSSSWSDPISEILSMIVYGWSFLEVVYKLRQGPNRDPSKNSKYNDGYLGWRKLPIRAQESKVEWIFDDEGGIHGLVQMALPSYTQVTIPIEKGLLFRTMSRKGNPEGRSLLRNAYRPWYFKKRIEELEAIGIERDLAGLPIAFVPPEILSPSATVAEQQSLNAIKNVVVNVRRDAQEGLVFPLAYDANGHQMYDFKLLSSGGGRQINTDDVINRHDKRIASSILADIVLLGQEHVGSFALASSKSSILTVALTSIVDSIAEVFNRFAVQPLFVLNGMSRDKYPELVHGDIEDIPLDEIAAYLDTLAKIGMPLFPDDTLEEWIRNLARMPKKSDQLKQAQEEEKKQAEAQAQIDQSNGQLPAEDGWGTA